MKKTIYSLIFSVFLFLLLLGCSRPKIEVISAEFVEDIYISGGQPLRVKGVKQNISVGEKGMSCSFEGYDIISVSLNVNNRNFITEKEIGSEDHRSEVYSILNKEAHLYNGNSKIRLIWGYQPEKTTSTTASNMKFFYIVPQGIDLNNLRFKFKISNKGEPTDYFIYSGFGKMKSLSKKQE